MFLKNKIEKYTKNYLEQIDKLNKAIKQADTIVIGAGAGLSTSAGFTYSGERFEKYFDDFIKKYGFDNMYSGGFYDFESLEEHWAYWSRYIYINRYVNPPKPLYENILKLINDKDYFVITTNVDHCFQKTGFDKKRLFYTQGDYNNEEIIKAMIKEQKNMKIPSELLPVCPNCGKPMTMNLRCDNTFVEDEGWHKAAERYQNFIRTRINTKILFFNFSIKISFLSYFD